MSNSFDLVVAGGGIQGLMVAYQAVRRGLRPLLVEREERLAQRTTAAWGKILHGGLRYLQNLDLVRHRRSVRERNWFLREFPDQTAPLPCLMPLYESGFQHPLVMKAALYLDIMLSIDEYWKMPPDLRLPVGRILSAEEVMRRVPWVPREGLRGGALWFDATIHRDDVMIGTLVTRIRAGGGEIRTGWEPTALCCRRGRLTGVRLRARDGTEDLIEVPVVINATGPWSRALAARLDRDVPELFTPSVAFNLWLDLEPPAAEGLAVRPSRADAQFLFLLPIEGGTLLGTRHLPWSGPLEEEEVPEREIEILLADARSALPGWPAVRERVRRIRAGFLPARRPGDWRQRHRDVLIDHVRLGGPAGFISICGIKYTTARWLAARALDLVERYRKW